MTELFIGSAICGVSSRGELTLPDPFCVAIQSRAAKDKLYIGFHDTSSCLIVFDRAGAADQHRRLAEERDRDAADLDRHDDLLRRAFGYAASTRMDGRGRLLIAPWMRERPGNRFRTLLVGKGDHFEVWNLNHVLEHGPQTLVMLARLHLHLLCDEDDRHDPALPPVEARHRARGVGEPGFRVQSLPALRGGHDQVVCVA